MTDKEKFQILWILCSERTKRQFLELMKQFEKKQQKDVKRSEQR